MKGTKRTRSTGVYELESTTRRHGGKPDACYYITFKDASGRKIWEKVGWRSEGYSVALATDRRMQRVQALRHGAPVPAAASRRITFGDAYRKWRDVHLSGMASERGITLLAERHLLPRFDRRTMAGIKSLDLETLKADLYRDGLSDQTVRHVLGIIRRVYRKALAWDLYDGPVPTAKVDMPKPDNARLRYLTHDEAARLLAALRAESPLWHDMAALSLGTGMRLGELLALRTGQVDLHAGVIHVLDAKAGTRAAYVSAATRPILESRMTPGHPDALLFPSPRGGGVMDKAGKPFPRAVRLCGLNNGVTDRRQKVVFHTLRHTFASWLAIDGVPLAVIGELLGHATMQMTQRYAKLSPDSKRSAVELVGNALRGLQS